MRILLCRTKDYVIFSKTQRLRPKRRAKRVEGCRWLALPALATIRSTAPSRTSFAAALRGVFSLYQRRKGEILMKNPLDSLWGTIISGLVLTVILYFVVKSILGQGI
jgi:hypothetical protein